MGLWLYFAPGGPRRTAHSSAGIKNGEADPSCATPIGQSLPTQGQPPRAQPPARATPPGAGAAADYYQYHSYQRLIYKS
jgi:hypothetical protein